MTLLEFYKATFPLNKPDENDYNLCAYTGSIFLGVDVDGSLSVVFKSISPSRCPLMQKTKLLSVECNVVITHCLSGAEEKDVVHVLKCYSQIDKEKELFLELIDSLLANKQFTDESIMEVFRTLINFFADKREPSDSELIGLYAELTTILSFANDVDMAKYWQSVDRMKFDFSVSDKVKLEVKATTKPFRTHHFRHEQLIADMYDIYIISYMLRYDDEGLSLLDIILQTKPLLAENYKKLNRINLILKNVSIERLANLKFSTEFTQAKQQIFRASDVPKFNQFTPDGVANAEYDCSLENISHLNRDDFIKVLKDAEKEENEDGEID